MSKLDQSQRMLRWLNNEKIKDSKEILENKSKIIKELKGLSKEDMFPKQPKLSLWDKIKIIILGN